MTIELKKDNTQPGIWRYHHYFPVVEIKYRLSLNEGDTAEIKYNGVIFKREDQNPTGSLKDRGLAYQISSYFQKGEKELVISSSGNAAISAAAYCRIAQIKLHVFISNKIHPAKLARLQDLNAVIYPCLRPVSEAIKFSKKNKIVNLRPSQDIIGHEGYKTLAFELHERLGRVDSLFLPVSSGTCLYGLAEGYKKIGYLPQFHLVQTTAVCPLAGCFDKDYRKTSHSLAEALVARVVPRKREVVEVVKRSNGWGWVVGDKEIRQAWSDLEKMGVYTSAEGISALAAVFKARRKSWELGEKVVCLLTGKKY